MSRMRIRIGVFAIFSLTVISCAAPQAIDGVGSLNNKWGQWISVPEGLDRFEPIEAMATVWSCTGSPLGESGFNASVGQVRFIHTGVDEAAFYRIGVEVKNGGIIAEFNVPLHLVAKDIQELPASEIVVFDSAEGNVTFNLGLSDFIFQFDSLDG